MSGPTASELRARIAEAEQAYDVERDHARTAARRGDRQQAQRHDTAADLIGEHLGAFEDQLQDLLAADHMSHRVRMSQP